MAKTTRNLKVRTLIKAYLVFNKGKYCTAKQISEWINSGGFCLNKSQVHPNLVSKLIANDRYSSSNMLSDVLVEKCDNRNYYWVEA